MKSNTHEFTKQMSIIKRESPHNYNFLTGYLMHASQYQNQNYNTRSQVYVKSILEKSQDARTLGKWYQDA